MSDFDASKLNPLDGEPFGQWVLCEKLEKLNLSKGGILLPENADLETTFARVHKIGPGQVSAYNNEYLSNTMGGLEPGDIVVLGSRYHGVGHHDRREWISCKPSDIIHVYKNVTGGDGR